VNSQNNGNESAFKGLTILIVRLCALVATLASLSTSGGLSDEIMVNYQWRDLETTTSLSINPSFPGYTERPTFSAAMASTQWGSFMLANSQLTIPLTSTMKWSQTLGIGLTGVSTGNIEKTNWVRAKIVRASDDISYSEAYGTIGYALRPINALSVGINLNVARQSNYGTPVIDGSFDVGASYRYENARIGNHLFGISLLNPAGISRFEKPVYTPDIGASWSVVSQPISDIITLRGGINANYRSIFGDNFGSSRRDLTARIGVTIRNMMTCYLQAGKYFVGLSAKVDLDTTWKPLGSQFSYNENEKSGRLAQFHKASAGYQLLKTEKQFRPTNTLYLSTEFGKSRDEGDNCFEMFRNAQKQYEMCNFWEAYCFYSIIERDCPYFPKIDEVRMRSAVCLEKLEQNRMASKKYEDVKNLYFNNSASNDAFVIGGAELGLYRLVLKDNDSAKAAEQYDKLVKSSAADTLKTVGRYLNGMEKMRNENRLAALGAFESITDKNHPVYPFAEYAKGVCFARNDELTSATDAFNAVVLLEKNQHKKYSGCAEAEALNEIINKARYALGVRNYEQFIGYANKLQVCDSIRNDVVTALGTAINFINNGGSNYTLVCPEKDSGIAIAEDSAIAHATLRALLSKLAGSLSSMDYQTIGSAFKIGRDSLTLTVGATTANIGGGGNVLLDAMGRVSSAEVTAGRNCALWLTDTVSHLTIVFEQINLNVGNDTLFTGCQRCRLSMQNAPSWNQNSIEDVLGISKKYASLLEQTESVLQGIPETSRWGADVLYLAAWMFFQMKNWNACEVVMEMIEDRAEKGEFNDVQPYMLADLILMKTVVTPKVNGALDRQSAILKRIEMCEKADSIMTDWLSGVNVIGRRKVASGNYALTALDSAANAQVDAQNEVMVDSLLDHSQLFKKILQDSISSAIALCQQKIAIHVNRISALTLSFNDSLTKKDGAEAAKKGKEIETEIFKRRDAVYSERDSITEILGKIATFEHHQGRAELILGIIGDIKKSRYSVQDAHPNGTAIDVTQPVLQQAPNPVTSQPATSDESDVEKLRRENEELRRLLQQR